MTQSNKKVDSLRHLIASSSVPLLGFLDASIAGI